MFHILFVTRKIHTPSESEQAVFYCSIWSVIFTSV